MFVIVGKHIYTWLWTLTYVTHKEGENGQHRMKHFYHHRKLFWIALVSNADQKLQCVGQI